MKRFWITAVVFVVFVVLGILWKTSLVQTEVNNSVEKKTDSAPIALTQLATSRVQNVSEAANDGKVEEVRRIVEAANVPINFWGKVIDQDGSPLAGVAVTYVCSIDHGNDQGVAWIQEETRKGEVASGTDGSFAILGLSGHDLTVESLTKAGYVYKSKLNHSYNFYGDSPLGRFVANQGQPIMFAMIREDRLEPLIQSKGKFRVEGNGTPEHWNLWSGETDPSGELAIIYRTEVALPANPAQRVNWSADLEIVGGGITEAPWEEDIRRAPEAGYSARVAYPKADQKLGVPHRSFYLRTADGKYGRIQIELTPSLDGRTARCLITGDMNPRAGSRNLEPPEEE